MPLDTEYVIRLNDFDLGQLLDGLEARATSWRHTAFYLETGEGSSLDFVVEECTDAEEAGQLADHYDRIIAQILEQMKQQQPI